MSELTTTERKFRHAVPDKHRGSLDTRLRWLWNQRLGTVQAVWANTDDLLDRTAATMLIQAIYGKDLNNIALVLKRLEGGPLSDEALAEEGVTI